MQVSFHEVEQLASNPWFRSHAPQLCREAGIPIPAGADATATLLVALHEKAPQIFETFVRQAWQVSMTEGAPKPPPMTKEQAALREKFGKALPPDRIAAAWKALPEKSGLRAKAKSPALESFAVERLAMAGLQPLPGMTPGETVVAYLHAANTSPALHSSRDGFRDLAAATGGVFGDEKELRQVAGHMADLHRTETTQREAAETTAKIIDRSRKHDAEVRKGRSLSKSDQPINPKLRDPNSIDRKFPSTDHKNTRDTVSELYKDAAGDEPPRVVVRDKKRLAGQLAYRKAAKESAAGLELTPQLRRELVTEARAQGYHFETDLSALRDDSDLLASTSEGTSAEPRWKPRP